MTPESRSLFDGYVQGMFASTGFDSYSLASELRAMSSAFWICQELELESDCSVLAEMLEEGWLL